MTTLAAATLADGVLLVGVEMTCASAGSMELVGGMAFDFAIVDTRHSALSAYSMELSGVVRAADITATPVLVRVAANTPGTINRAMNDGAAGILVSCDDADDAARASASMRYPPDGVRGAAPVVRAARFGLTSWDDYRRATNETKPLVLSIEDERQLAAIGELADVDGVDAMMFDLAPLQSALGSTIETPGDCELLVEAMAAVRRRDKPMGVVLPGASVAPAWRDAGCRLIVLGTDAAAYGAATLAMRLSLDDVPVTLAGAAT